ncbi:MAG TPA: TIGR03943 family protein [Syntrophomonas sp.]|nr:TIGR03943 family protein [Syntrophomonas sp.]
MRARSFNPQIFLEFLCYSIFGCLIFDLVRSGQYLSYVTPRMEPYFYFTVIIMGIWALAGLGRLFRPQHKIRSAHCFVLAIPILLLLLPHSPLNASDLAGNYIGGNVFSGQSNQSSYNAHKQDPSTNAGASSAEPTNDSSAIVQNDLPSATDSLDTAAPDTQTSVSEGEYSTGLPGLDIANKKITVSNDDFDLWFSEIYSDMEKYKGYTVIMTGYVYKDPEFMKSNEFVPARLMMSCCVADLSPAGIICRYDKASALKEDSWVTVTGTLFIGQYEYDGHKYDDPQLIVTKITPAEKVEGYVYP